MRYPFVYRSVLIYVETPMSRSSELHAEMEAAGWRRVYEAPQVFVLPGYTEALEESDAMATANDRQAAQGRIEASRDIVEAARA